MLIQCPMKRSLEEKPEDQIVTAVCHYDTWDHPSSNNEVAVPDLGDLRAYYNMSEYSDSKVRGLNLFNKCRICFKQV